MRRRALERIDMEEIGLVCLFGLTAFDDIKTKQVRLAEIIGFGALGLLFNAIYQPHSLLSIFGGVMIGCLIYIYSIVSNEKIGKGDGLIVMVAGLYLGFSETVMLLWISSTLAAVVGTIMVKKHGARMDIELPFVPFLLMGYLLIDIVNTIGGIIVCG